MEPAPNHPSFLRTAMLLGEDSLARLSRARVAVFGLGGVGSFAAEALARAGIGALHLIDHDVISPSNLNRQLIATLPAVGQKKVLVAKERIRQINPDAVVEASDVFCLPENIGELLRGEYDYLLDAVDTVSAKLAIIDYGRAHGVPTISVMGTGNKLDPSRFRAGDIYETGVCPLCRVMRRELRRRGVTAARVIWSDEPPLTPLFQPEDSSRRGTPGSVSFVPPVAGMIAAGEVVRTLANLPDA